VPKIMNIASSCFKLGLQKKTYRTYSRHMVDKTKNFAWSTTFLLWPKNFVTQIRDLFAVSYFLVANNNVKYFFSIL